MRFRQELKLVTTVAILYVCFVSWGYLQEKITSTTYTNKDDSLEFRWKYPIVLNCLMAFAAFCTASLAEFFIRPHDPTPAPIFSFTKPALSCALASPIGYMALDFINFPLMILAKSSKPVPVMLIGILFYGQQYTWFKYLSVVLICGGIILFSAFKSHHGDVHRSFLDELTGIALILINLFLDGYTSNQQDYIFHSYRTPSETMMKNVNLFQCLFMVAFLVGGLLLWGDGSELSGAYTMLLHSNQVGYDILLFCLCASIGQLFIFSIMKDFGSLVWITVCSKLLCLKQCLWKSR